MTRDTAKKPEKEAKKDEDKKDGDIKEELVGVPPHGPGPGRVCCDDLTWAVLTRGSACPGGTRPRGRGQGSEHLSRHCVCGDPACLGLAASCSSRQRPGCGIACESCACHDPCSTPPPVAALSEHGWRGCPGSQWPGAHRVPNILMV